ncbi:MAG: hypothetical protein K1060chlam1_00723 [Candidatus Anoxychlamydiales bacterium]|nr:hypothetical protein [Candidatus Anoxychlamydiales bacterium]
MFNFKNILILLTLTSMTSVFCVSNQKTISKKYYDSGHPIEKHHLMQAYSAPARVDVDGRTDAFLEGSLLYWQPKETGLAIAQSTSSDLLSDPIKIFNFKSNYKTGFKAAIGIHSNTDDWTLLASYTRFNRDMNTTINQAIAFSSDWLNGTSTQVHAKWDVDFNMFELSLSRDNYTGKHLILSPLAGIKGGWFNQKYNVTSLTNGSESFSDSWLIGPIAGVKGLWKLRGEFKVFTDISAAIFYQDFYKVSYQEKNLTTDVFSQIINMNKKYLVPNLNLAAGLNYGAYFFKDKFHIDFLVKYEFMNYWNQNQMRHLINLLLFTRFNPGSFMLHGLTASMRLDF